ncbi:MAG: hypothetical protein A3F09_00020 [Chlamydiae bacterium RIFCSPHIGHO2_12_FULL_49_11]|nr:MAG: hypothetical protein A3F09_00020 [Chlamydiae bacterium RIFCSPHIGHO2_12_FULL_49_11]
MEPEENKPKSGFTVQELQGKAKKFGLEIALCVIFVLTAIFALVWSSAYMVWSILLGMIFAIVGALLPKSVHKFTTSALRFIYREKATSIVFAVLGLVLAVALPMLIFGMVGLIAGKSFLIDSEEHRPEK